MNQVSPEIHLTSTKKCTSRLPIIESFVDQGKRLHIDKNRKKKISSTGSLLSLHSSTSISSIGSYIRANNTRNLKEFAAESSYNEVNKMILLGEALGLGNSALLEKFYELIIRQLEKEKEDWQKQQ